MENYLVLKFQTEVEGKKFTLTVRNVKTDLDQSQILQLVNEILAANVISTDHGKLTECISAELVTKNVVEIDLA